MATYGSPLMFNSYQPRFRAFNELSSPSVTWGPAAGRLNYSSPISTASRSPVNSGFSHSSKINYPPDEAHIPHMYAGSPRQFYGSPLAIGSPVRRCESIMSSDRSHNLSVDFPDASVHLASISRIVQDDSDASPARIEDNGHRLQARTTLPSWTLDSAGQVRLSLAEILQHGQLKMFARDKLGCQFLQNNFPRENNAIRQKIVQQVLESEENFELLCSDVFGNFFVQKLIECSNVYEQRWVSTRLLNKMNMLCLNRYSCRVVQKAIEVLPLDLKGVLLVELHKADIVRLSVDQNANHVVQKIMNSFPLNNWSFIIENMTSREDQLFNVAENKYGCRVVQLAIEILSTTRKSANSERLLAGILKIITSNCERLASNEFANYVIQHVISAGPLSMYRDQIIEECILTNILSMAQEKYASHVVEKALEFAPPALMKEMMDEIFDGYVPHPDSKKDALDIMMFHQYGNYVIQRMLNTCVEAARARKAGIDLADMSLRLKWLKRVGDRIRQNENKLCKYSSGKKIIDMLERCPPVDCPLDVLARDLAAALPPLHPSPVYPPRSYA